MSSKPFSAPVRRADELSLQERLRNAGIDVLDLAPEMWRLKLHKPVFLRHDTHWTPDAMKVMAEFVARHIREKYSRALTPPASTPVIDARLLDRSSYGDLVGLLDLSSPEEIFAPDEATLVSIVGLDPDKKSSVLLLGGSFVNVFDDPALGFATEDEFTKSQRLKAGFANQLAVLLNQPLDVMTDDDAGPAAMLDLLATRSDDELRGKKLVVWLIASRHLTP